MAVQPELPGDAAQSDPNGEPLGRLWAFLASPACAAILLALAALLLLLSALFPQLSPVTSGDSARERWLAETAARWGSLGSTLRSMGAFDIENSLLWKICLGLGIWMLLVRLEVAARRAWARARGDASRMDVRFREEDEAAERAESVLAGARRSLEASGFRVRVSENGRLVSLHAVRRAWAGFLPVACTLGALLIVGSLLLSGITAQWEQVALGPGESASLTLRTGWSAMLKDFAADSGGTLAVFGPEAGLLAQGSIARQRPLWARGLTLHLSGTGPGLQASATESGKAMQLQPASGASPAESLFLRFDEDQPEQYFAVPDVGDTVRVVLHPGTGGTNEFLVQVYRGTEVKPKAETVLSGEGSLTLENVTCSFKAMEYPLLIVSSNPARWLLWAGATLAILAALAMIFVRPGTVLVRAAEQNGRTALQYLGDNAEAVQAARRAASNPDERSAS